MLSTFTFIIVFLLSACELNMYDTFNQAVQNIEAEESGYVFFTDQFMIDGDTALNLDDLFERILSEENIDVDMYMITILLLVISYMQSLSIQSMMMGSTNKSL